MTEPNFVKSTIFADTPRLLAVTDQASKRILLLDPEVPDWKDGRAVKWSWHPNAEHSLHAWGLPSDVKLRHSPHFEGLCMLVTDSYGLAAIVSYPEGGAPRWACDVGGNPHAAELLPDGNMAIAASHGGWVRLYTASQSDAPFHYAEYELPGAHGVLWDPTRQVLWTVGDDYLTALVVSGTSSAPLLQEDPSLRSYLPTRYGHDLSPVYGDTNRLWVTTNYGVYHFDKSAVAWSEPLLTNDPFDLRFVKSIGNFPNGPVVLTKPEEGCLYEWATDKIHQFQEEAVFVKDGAAIYKARIWRPDYC
ncbi:DUF6528 family protein [Paenibacillus aurantius]|uniref:DUF6528 family protein n=1 Tax=Paenibacillus aurantius TaxID=2918900 RepID=A0AA96LJ62_9BACL|nr:DUF6528 family protein [Paenibacillus aurantius]WNQ13968.1 DUF6528 family protein [Paenibacillus aurantius]